MPIRDVLPQKYTDMAPAELEDRIAQHKDRLGAKLCILGHHYQRDEVIRFADFAGDSLKLSQLAAEQTDAEFIVFCGVHFMAESADILSGDSQTVILPNMLAGCAMAEMADESAVAAALDEVCSLTDEKVIPITYVNSTATIKAITAEHDGACCTSSNVRNVFTWALRSTDTGGAGAAKIFAIPDQHLATNTAVAMGYSLSDCVVYDPAMPNGGLSARQIADATFILWKGHCYVHQLFTPAHVRSVRERHPDISVIVHPECPHEVVQLADASGSTSQIITAIASGEPQSQWAIGTESNLVNRLARTHADMFIRVLSDAPAACAQMQRIDLAHLTWVLDQIADGSPANIVTVDARTAKLARIALQRMIDIKAVGELTGRPKKS